MGLLHNDVGLASELVMAGKDLAYLRDWAEVRLEESAKSVRVPELPQPDNQATSALELAALIALQFNIDTDPLCTLAALLKPGVGFSSDQLKSLPITQKEALALHNAPIYYKQWRKSSGETLCAGSGKRHRLSG